MPVSTRLLDTIQEPQTLHDWPADQLTTLCDEIRSFLLESISKTGGHIGANLGTIELTVGLHAVFNSPQDKILFDTGHQGYTHKLLTGRKNLFESLNQPFGMSRFIAREESPHDIMDATHAGTAISTASGIALANKLQGKPDISVAVVGDGSMIEGNCFEGLNFGVMSGLPLVIVLNDNGMAIAPNVGGIKNLLSGENWQEKAQAFFTGLGYQYLAVSDGHNIVDLVKTFRNAQESVKKGPVVVHVKTIKGKGLHLADGHPYRMHFSMAFDLETGKGASPTVAGETYAVVASKTLHELMASDESIVAITPATPYASNVDQILRDYPTRAIDVGMAEQHAVSMAAGLALEGKHPVVCFQSTFMQRAMDQIIHDLCYMNLPATILAVRSGFAGFDGPTHHGVYDLSYLQALPHLKLFYAGTRYDVDAVLRWRMANPEGPMVILHPYEPVWTGEWTPEEGNDIITRPEIIGPPEDTVIISMGNCLKTATELQAKYQTEGHNSTLVNIRWIKPFPESDILPLLQQAKRVITIEENILTNGLGARIACLIADYNLPTQLYRAGVPDAFIRFGDKSELIQAVGIDAETIFTETQRLFA